MSKATSPHRIEDIRFKPAPGYVICTCGETVPDVKAFDAHRVDNGHRSRSGIYNLRTPTGLEVDPRWPTESSKRGNANSHVRHKKTGLA